ncbi:hypothetical protein ACJIZ3_010238 [Penstemon smallii]|uniref:Uncharacterized protein n=1 Tax=Penstemon smallii TaxID=265156 RepID=A0ABD3TER1_9LAMI
MSFFQQNILTSLSSNFDERQWIKQIRQTLDEEIDEETEIPVTIFGVPKTLILNDPNSYIPQQVAIGPYHHLKPELYDMERYKIAAAKRNQKELQNDLKFEHLVDHLMKHELRIRATYHRPLNFKGETLAWMMAVDSSFLFEFLQVCGVKEDQLLLDMLIGLSKELSPFKTLHKIELRDSAHFVDFLYQSIVPKLEVLPTEIIEIHEDEGEDKEDEDKDSLAKPSFFRQVIDELWKILSRLEEGPVQWIKRVIFSKPLKVLVKLPWTIVTKIPILKMLKEPLEHVFSAMHQGKEKIDDDKEGSSSKVNKPPSLDEITIPSVTQLLEVGVQILPTNEDVNSEVVLRNLVAYEACSASGPLVLSRYTELMNGIIDTDVDAKFLCEKGIIVNHLKSENEVANLWNGMIFVQFYQY